MAHPDGLVPEDGAPSSMREQGERERVLFESCPLPLWIFDRGSQSISHANSAACRNYGHTRDGFAGLTLLDFLIHIRELIEPIEDLDRPTRGRWFCTLQDIAEQKRSQEPIRRAHEELEARAQNARCSCRSPTASSRTRAPRPCASDCRGDDATASAVPTRSAAAPPATGSRRRRS